MTKVTPKYNRMDREKWNAYMRKYTADLRANIFLLLGGKCKKCGFSDIRALQVDHINGGGVKEHKLHKSRQMYWRNILKSIAKGEKKYQLLCANCNWIKRSTNCEL